MANKTIDTDALINNILMTDQAGTPSTPASGKSRIYTKSDGLYWIDDAGAVTGPLLDAVATSTGDNFWSGNLIKNYPSLEIANGAQPEWWEEEDANITLTEEDATGESCTGLNERVLKVVTGAAGDGKYIYQRLTYADEPTLYASTTAISGGCWVYQPSGSSGVTLTLYDSSGGALGTDNTVTTESWTWLEVTNQTLGAGTYVDFRITISGNSKTCYVANPTVNVGALVLPFVPRRLIYVDKYVANVYNSSSATSWTDLDFTSNTSNLTVGLNLGFELTSSGNISYAYIRRNGSSASLDESTLVIMERDTKVNGTTNAFIACDDGQIIEHQRYNSASGYTGYNLAISMRGYWEWAS